MADRLPGTTWIVGERHQLLWQSRPGVPNLLQLLWLVEWERDLVAIDD